MVESRLLSGEGWRGKSLREQQMVRELRIRGGFKSFLSAPTTGSSFYRGEQSRSQRGW